MQDMSLDDFHSALVNKTLDLFPSLTEEDLKPYILHSKAQNAYDAVTLLAKSVDVVFDQGGDSCRDANMIRVALEKIFLVSYRMRL